MTASPYASAAKITEAVEAIEAEYVGTRKQTLLQQIFVACATGGATPSAPPIPQNLRLAATQNANSITVEWDALAENPDYDVEVYTPDDVWVSLGGTMGGITKEYGPSDGMVYTSTYSFRVRSTFDFVTFSAWSAPLFGVVAPRQTIYYLDQGSGLWDDAANWFQDQAGTIPLNSTPSSAEKTEIKEGNTVDEVPNDYENINNGTVINNNGLITANNGTINTNSNQVATNNGTVITNNGTVTTNSVSGTITNNYATITTNNGTVTVNESAGTVTHNCGTIVTNDGYEGPCA